MGMMPSVGYGRAHMDVCMHSQALDIVRMSALVQRRAVTASFGTPENWRLTPVRRTGVRQRHQHRLPASAPHRPGSVHRKVVTRLQAAGTEDATAMTSSSTPSSRSKRVGVLFVCLGNICRSPTAEAMFRAVVQRNGLENQFEIDSCGTGGGNPDWYMEGGWSYHEGDASDSRMSATAKKRGVILTSRSRPLVPVDLSKFDYVIGMDPRNSRAVQTAGSYWSSRKMGEGVVPPDFSSKLSLMTQYCQKYEGASEVPDPYYGGPEGFEKVLDLLDDACEGLLQVIRKEKGF